MSDTLVITSTRMLRETINTFGDRVETLLTSRGCSKTWLAKELNISKQALNHILKNNKAPKYVSEIALIFNINPKWLATGEGKVHCTTDSLVNRIPLFELSAVLSSNSISKITCINRILFSTTNEHNHFAVLFNKYPSMSSQFEENSILIFDQQLVPKNKSYVLACIDEKNSTFRQFYKENNTIILKSLDKDYESIKCNNKCQILGTLVETRIKF